MGKTQLVARFAQEHRDDYDVGWWIRAENPTTLIDDYCRLGVKLGLLPEERAFDHETVAVVKDWLDRSSRWILVFDNAPDPASLVGAIPDGVSGHVLITSRRHADWRQLGAEPMTLDVWDRRESVAFLLGRTGSEDGEGAAAVAGRLGDLPLALEQAACYVNQQAIDLREYDSRWQDRSTQLLAHGQPLGYEHTILTTWQVAFSELTEDRPGAAIVLAICSLLAADAIPRSLLADLDLKGAGPVDDAIEALLSYGLISSAGEMLGIHRLVQHIVRRAVLDNPALCDFLVNQAGAVLCDQFPGDPAQPDEWRVCRLLIPHALALLNLAVDQGNEPGMKQARLHFLVGNWLTTQGDWSGARAQYERALEIETKHLGEGHLLLVRTHGNLGAALAHEGELEEAQKHLQIALDMEKTIWGEGSAETAVSMGNIGVLLHSTGDHAASKEALMGSLEVLNRLPLDDLEPHQKRQMVNGHLNLASVYSDCEETDKCKEALDLARADSERIFPEPHPMTAKAEAELGNFYRVQGDLQAARVHLKAAISIAQSAWPDDHPEIGVRLMSLARLLLLSDDTTELRQHLEATVDWFERAYGPESSELVEPLGFLALACAADADLDAARHHLLAALKWADGETLGYPGVTLTKENLDEELPTLAERVLTDGNLLS